MKPKSWSYLAASYRLALSVHVSREDEATLQRAYELGREALNRGCGVVDVARLHQEAMVKLVARYPNFVAGPRQIAAAETFLMETLSAFEVAHRGFRDACDRLQRLNVTIKDRHEQLAVSLKRIEREVNRRKKTQELLAESELKFRSVVESAQDGIITVDAKGTIVGSNQSAAVMFGRRPSEMVGRPVTRLIPKPLRAAAMFTLSCLAKGSERQHLKRPIQSVGLHRDGNEFSIELTLATWRTRAGIFFTGIVRDVTERKRAEVALRESREHYIRLFNEARAMEENLRQLSSRVLTVQEDERKRISRELHDEIGQSLTAVNVSMALLRSHAPDDEAFGRRVSQSQRLIEQTMETVTRFARELRPSMLDHLGPVAALQNYVKSFTERTGLKIELEGDVQVEQLNPQQGTVLYRVAQESLTNVFKHAQATRVKIRLRQLPCAVCMEIIDNGRAFPIPNGKSIEGRQPLGVLGMQERVRLVNGQFAIESLPKRGTTVRVEIPVTATAPVAEPSAATASN